MRRSRLLISLRNIRGNCFWVIRYRRRIQNHRNPGSLRLAHLAFLRFLVGSDLVMMRLVMPNDLMMMDRLVMGFFMVFDVMPGWFAALITVIFTSLCNHRMAGQHADQ